MLIGTWVLGHTGGPARPGGASSGGPGSEAATKTKDAPGASTTTVTSTELQASYEQNEVAADEKYKDKEIDVKGYVKSVSKGPLGGDLRRSRGPDGITERPLLIRQSQTAKVAELQYPENTVIRGTCRGLSLGTIILVGCEVLKSTKEVQEEQSREAAAQDKSAAKRSGRRNLANGRRLRRKNAKKFARRNWLARHARRSGSAVAHGGRPDAGKGAIRRDSLPAPNTFLGGAGRRRKLRATVG